MVDLSLTRTEQKTQNYGKALVQLKFALTALVRRVISRRRLLGELDGLTDHVLQDIGLDQPELRYIRKWPLFDKNIHPLV